MTPNKEEQIEIPKESTISLNIHNLPPELLHMICIYLEPKEVAGIHLLDRTIAAVPGIPRLSNSPHSQGRQLRQVGGRG